MEKVKIILVFGSTGCSCCRCENFVEGVYMDPQAAQSSIDSHRQRRTVASQYSATGIYEMREVEAEALPNGRFIVGNRVIDESCYETGEGIYDDLRWATQPIK